MPASGPWARRRPNSITVPPSAACTTRLALVAISVWWLMMFSSAVSTSCASKMGAVTRISGSPGNTMVPSGTAYTSP